MKVQVFPELRSSLGWCYSLLKHNIYYINLAHLIFFLNIGWFGMIMVSNSTRHDLTFNTFLSSSCLPTPESHLKLGCNLSRTSVMSTCMFIQNTLGASRWVHTCRMWRWDPSAASRAICARHTGFPHTTNLQHGVWGWSRRSQCQKTHA